MTDKPSTILLKCTSSSETYAVSFEDGSNASIRRLERTLALAGLADAVTRGDNRLYFPGSRLHAIIAALEGTWNCRMAPEVSAALAEINDSEDRLARSLRCARLLSNPTAAALALIGFDASVLDEHQRIAVAIASHPDISGFCLFDEQGLGKTVTTIMAFHRLRQLGEVSRMLVVAPKNMLLEWARDFNRFTGDTYSVGAVAGSQREKRAIINQRHDVLVLNFETAVNLELRLRDMLKSESGRCLLVVDESFFVKNRETRRAQVLIRLRRNVQRCIVLCGTPAPNSPHDLVEQVNVADGGIAFRGIEVPKEAEAARRVVQSILHARCIYLRRLKDDVLPDLPKKMFHKVLVPMQPIQTHAYARALQSYVDDLGSTDEILFKKSLASFLARRSTLLQICSCPTAALEDYDETPSKHLALDSILEDLILQRQEKVVIWSFYVVAIDNLMLRYRRYNPVRCDGSVAKPEDRREAVRRFQEDDETMLFIANPAAAGTGLTLHRARFAIYESMSNQAAHYLQSLDRIHRRGQMRPVEYVVLLCDSTLEVIEYERLQRKEHTAQELLGDAINSPVTREVLLREALEAARMLSL